MFFETFFKNNAFQSFVFAKRFLKIWYTTSLNVDSGQNDKYLYYIQWRV